MVVRRAMPVAVGTVDHRVDTLVIRRAGETAPRTGGIHQPRYDSWSVDVLESSVTQATWPEQSLYSFYSQTMTTKRHSVSYQQRASTASLSLTIRYVYVSSVRWSCDEQNTCTPMVTRATVE